MTPNFNNGLDWYNKIIELCPELLLLSTFNPHRIVEAFQDTIKDKVIKDFKLEKSAEDEVYQQGYDEGYEVGYHDGLETQ